MKRLYCLYCKLCKKAIILSSYDENLIILRITMKTVVIFSRPLMAFNNYVDKRGWVGGQVNVYACKVKGQCLLTSFVYEGWVGGPKSPKICLCSYWMPPKHTFLPNFEKHYKLKDLDFYSRLQSILMLIFKKYFFHPK